MEIALRVFRHEKYQEIVKASDVDAGDLTDLVCRCVECGQFVNWVAGNDVSALKKRVAHFRHERQVDSRLAMICEKRVARYSKDKLDKLERTIAQSRCRYIRENMWRLMIYYFSEVLDFPVNHILEVADSDHREIGELLADRFRTEKIDHAPAMSNIINAVFAGQEVWFPNPYAEKSQYAIVPSIAIQQHFREQISGELNRKLHEFICIDVLQFLKKTKSSREIAIRLFTLASYTIFDAIKDGVKLGFFGRDGSELHVRVGSEIGVSHQFLANPANQYIFYVYGVSHVLMWVALTPYNQTIGKIHERT